MNNQTNTQNDAPDGPPTVLDQKSGIEAGQTIKWKGVEYYIKEVFRSRFGDMKVRMSALYGRDHCIVNLNYLEDNL